MVINHEGTLNTLDIVNTELDIVKSFRFKRAPRKIFNNRYGYSIEMHGNANTEYIIKVD